jgi:voltage-gated potassium channel
VNKQHENKPDLLHTQRLELLEHLNNLSDKPLVALSFVWLALLILDLTSGLGPLLQTLSTAIWGIFIVDFVLEFAIAPRKLHYLRRNWLTVISLVLPALRVLRVARALRVLRAARAVRSLSLLRLLTSLNRGMRATRKTLGRRGVGYVVALTVVVTVVGAAGMAFFESPQALREAGYTADAAGGLLNYGEALWWTAMIMTTMGSEYWPQTAEGRILSWLLSLYAFAIFGYITATIASYFVGQDQVAQAPVADASAELAALRQEIAALQAAVARPVQASKPNDTWRIVEEEEP